MDQVCHRLVLAHIRPSFRPGAPKIISTLRPPSVIVPTGRTRKKSYSLLSRGGPLGRIPSHPLDEAHPLVPPKSPSRNRSPFGIAWLFFGGKGCREILVNPWRLFVTDACREEPSPLSNRSPPTFGVGRFSFRMLSFKLTPPPNRGFGCGSRSCG
jgi:hypothetical protein